MPNWSALLAFILLDVRPADLFLYLVGNRGAIERIAASRRALWAGALLVVSAGIARNYDHLFLLAEPEWILGPFGMSLVSAVLIWFMLWAGISFTCDGKKGPAFRKFLTLFWLTAPCAWLYGIPVERFTDLLGATQWNFAFLMVVSVWRVALIVRAVRVLTGAGIGRVLALVLLPACLEMFLGSAWKGLSLVGIMGGVRLPPHHEFIRHASGLVMVGSFWLGIACLAGVIYYAASGRGMSSKPLCRERTPENPGVMIAAFACLASWVFVAVPMQGPVRNHDQLKRYFAAQQWRAGIAFAAARQRSDFSSIHFLPPDPFGKMYGSSYFEILESMDGSEPEWLRKVWINQAIMEFERRLLPKPDKAVLMVLLRYPEISVFLAQEAVRLKAEANLDQKDADWLREYTEITDPQKEANNAPP